MHTDAANKEVGAAAQEPEVASVLADTTFVRPA